MIQNLLPVGEEEIVVRQVIFYLVKCPEKYVKNRMKRIS